MSMTDDNEIPGQGQQADPGESWSPDDDTSAAAPAVDPDQIGSQTPSQDTLSPGTPAPEGADAFGSDIAPGQASLAQQQQPNVKRIASYLMGDGGANPAAAKKLVDAEKAKGLNDDDANLLAVQKAYEMGGPQGAWSMMQYNRTAYNAKQAFANAAFNGTQGKPPDISAAADAATKAASHVLDGGSAAFHADRSGVVATVTLPGTTQRHQINLTPQQFGQYLDVGKEGQYDRQMENGGVAATLQKIAGSKPVNAPFVQSLDGSGTSGAGNDPRDVAAAAARRKQGLYAGDQPALPGQFDENGHYLGKPPSSDPNNYGEELENRATARFGKGNVNAEGERQQWMADQEGQDLGRQNKLDVAKQQGINATKVAMVRGQYGNQIAGTRAQGQQTAAQIKANAAENGIKAKLAQQAQNSQDLNQRARARNLFSLMNGQTWSTLDDGQKEQLFNEAGVAPPQAQKGWFSALTGSGAAAPQAATPQAPTPRASGASQGKSASRAPAPARARLADGKYYVKGPDGKAHLDQNQNP